MDIPRILQKIRPNCSYYVDGNTYEGVVWQDETTQKPSIKEIEDAWQILKKEFLWEGIRLKRNSLLQETDYTQVEDFKGNKEVWANYRAALRNVPQLFGDPDSVIWPTKPE